MSRDLCVAGHLRATLPPRNRITMRARVAWPHATATLWVAERDGGEPVVPAAISRRQLGAAWERKALICVAGGRGQAHQCRCILLMLNAVPTTGGGSRQKLALLRLQ